MDTERCVNLFSAAESLIGLRKARANPDSLRHAARFLRESIAILLSAASPTSSRPDVNPSPATERRRRVARGRAKPDAIQIGFRTSGSVARATLRSPPPHPDRRSAFVWNRALRIAFPKAAEDRADEYNRDIDGRRRQTRCISADVYATKH